MIVVSVLFRVHIREVLAVKVPHRPGAEFSVPVLVHVDTLWMLYLVVHRDLVDKPVIDHGVDVETLVGLCVITISKVALDGVDVGFQTLENRAAIICGAIRRCDLD